MKYIRRMVATIVLSVAILHPWSRCAGQESGEITLSQAVSQALQHSPTIAIARAQYASLTNQVRVIRDEFLPTLYTGAAAAYTNGLPEALAGQPPSLFQLTYSELIFDQPTRGRLKAAEDRAKSQENELQHVRDAVSVDTATSYLELERVRSTLDLLRDERSNAQDIIDFMQKRAGAGLALSSDVTRAEITLAKIDQRTVQSQNQSRVLTSKLLNAMGLPPGTAIDLTDEPLPALQPPVGDPVDLVLQNSDEIQRAETEAAARNHIFKGERGGYWPSVELFGQYNVLSKFNNYTEFFKTFQRNDVSIGVVLRMPVFNPGIAANAALAKSQLKEAELNLTKLHGDEEAAAEEKAGTVAENDAALKVATLELKLAEDNLAVLQKEFDLGQAFSKDLDEARLDQLEKRIAIVEMNCASEEAHLALMQATGRLSSVFK